MPSTPPTPPTVLIIDDDAATVGLMREILEQEGYRVRHALGTAALALVRTDRPAVILLDLQMPGLAGPALARHLRADPVTAAVPIVCVSGTLARGGRVPADLPHDDALAKPFAVAALVATVARWTPRHDADGG